MEFQRQHFQFRHLLNLQSLMDHTGRYWIMGKYAILHRFCTLGLNIQTCLTKCLTTELNLKISDTFY